MGILRHSERSLTIYQTLQLKNSNYYLYTSNDKLELIKKFISKRKIEVIEEPKKILIVSRTMYPVNSPRSFRTTELAKEFARQGHEVTLLTLKNSAVHPEFEKEHGVTIKDLGPLTFSDIDTSGKNRFAVLFKRALRRGLYQVFEYPNIELLWKTKQALEKESGYDLLITIAVPHQIHWGTAWARRSGKEVAKTWVADCGDPFMGNTLDSFSKMFYFKYFEKAFCRQTDFITVPMENAKEGYYPEFREKIEVISQGFRFDEIEIEKDLEPNNPVPTFAYAGGLFPGGRDPRPFLNYLTGLNKEFKFLLYTQDTNLVDPFVEKSEGRIEIRNYIPRPELLKVLSRMDFLVNFENASSLMMPSKLIDYYLTARPVLSVKSNEVNSEGITRFLKNDYRDRYRFNGVERFRIENVCNQFLKLLNKDKER